ncbi:TPA: dihydrofolate reductase [Vibrio vulnificus]|uniref:dihydrofolate reductase n=1 Tax=Vibrio vulnificus TaxID=672 RepID=A0A8H9TFM6_VIBVL|nr:dihydrofolate reductase [Vibrio vulnificus]HAS8540911.1 dihydrofolate reductase [Vibrio vulnificus]
MITIISAVDSKFAIGKGNKLPWNCPSDLKFFKRETLNKIIVMGANTWDSLSKYTRPLPDRINCVLSKSELVLPDGVMHFRSLEEVLNLAEANDVYIIGGAGVYRQFVDFCDRMILTHLDIEVVDADTFFPKFTPVSAKKITSGVDEASGIGYEIIEYKMK